MKTQIINNAHILGQNNMAANVLPDPSRDDTARGLSGVGAGAAAAAMAAPLFHNNNKKFNRLTSAHVNDMQVVFKSIARASSS